MSKLKFPENALRETIPELHRVCKIASGKLQAAFSLTFTSMLSYINHPVQMRFRASSEAHGSSPSSIIAFAVAKTGERKDAVDKYFRRTMDKYQDSLLRTYDMDVIEKRKQRLFYEQQLKTNPRDTTVLKDYEPPLIPFVVSDAPTKEGILRAIDGGYPFHSIFSNEGGIFFTGYSNSKENSISTLGFLCSLREGRFGNDVKANNLEIEKVERGTIRRGRSNIAFSMYMAMQPIILQEMLANSLVMEAQGFLGRCFIVKPESLATKRVGDTGIPEYVLEEAVGTFHARLKELYHPVFIEDGKPKSGLKFTTMKVSSDDKGLLEDFFTHFELYTGDNTMLHYIAPFIKRRIEHVLSIAVTLQAYVNCEVEYISTPILKLAIELFQFYASEANAAIHEAKSKQKREKIKHEVIKFMDNLKKGLAKNTKWIDESFKINTSVFRGITRITADRIRDLINETLRYGLIRRTDDEEYCFVNVDIENNSVIVDSEYNNESFPYFCQENNDEPPFDDEKPEEVSFRSAVKYIEVPKVISFDNKEQVNLIRSRVNLVEYVTSSISLRNGMGLCPFHQEKTPSFSVKPEYFKCFGCDAKGDIYDFIALSRGISISSDFPTILSIAAEYAGVELQNTSYSVGYIEDKQAIAERNKRWEKEKAETLKKYELDKEQNYERSKSLYELGIYLDPPYLSNRCGRNVNTPANFRFAKEYYHTESKTNCPIMIAPLVRENKLTGVHITFLDSTGSVKAEITPNKKFLGTSKGSHIELHCPNNTDTLIIAEGIETGISASKILGKEQFACFSAGAGYNMKELAIPSQFINIIIAGDNGESGREYANAAKATYEQQGFKVDIYYPPERFSDFNDYEYFLEKEAKEECKTSKK
jgi:hypothetical protein